MKFSPVKNLSDQIADYLIDEIVTLKILPEERLLEKNIAKKLGVSRSPVREAFRILEQTGLVELIPRCGARVSGMSEDRIEAYCDMFVLVLGHMIRRCIKHYRPEHLNALTRYVNQLEICANHEDYRNFYEILLKCLDIVISATNNPALSQVIRSIMPNLKRLQYITFALKTHSLQDNITFFRNILDSISEKNVEKGVFAIRAYIDHEKSMTLNALKKQTDFCVNIPAVLT